MERIRYFVGVPAIIVGPPGLLYWLIIHSWVRWWRAWGLIRTYLAIPPGLGAASVLLFHYREQLMGRDLGTNWGPHRGRARPILAHDLAGAPILEAIELSPRWWEFRSYRSEKAHCCERESMKWCAILGI
jgi:hypothetical protein